MPEDDTGVVFQGCFTYVEASFGKSLNAYSPVRPFLKTKSNLKMFSFTYSLTSLHKISIYDFLQT